MQPSMTGVGKTIRMNRIFKDGKAVAKTGGYRSKEELTKLVQSVQ